jgi:hypothetical protein
MNSLGSGRVVQTIGFPWLRAWGPNTQPESSIEFRIDQGSIHLTVLDGAELLVIVVD